MTKRKALSAVFGALALGLAPAPDTLPSAWARDTLVIPDGPRAGQKWDPALTPYLVEIVDQLAAQSATTMVAVRKSAQVGFSQIGQVWLGYIIDIAPARAMMVLPTIQVAQDFNRDKLSPSISATPELRAKVRSQASRSSEGSTALNKRFDGGSIVITGANSTADLRSKTVKFAFADEVSEWPADLDGQGDPLEMLKARQISFSASGDWKRLCGSTPTIKGACRATELFEGGDQRFWMVRCPHCGAEQRLRFRPDSDGRGGLRFNQSYPYNAYYACEANGCVIEHHEKRAMIQGGRWVATEPGPGRYPSYHLDALISLLTTWDAVAEAFLNAKDDPAKLKGFVNLWLGEAWEERGEAPEWERLYARREDYPARTIPPGALVFTAGCDVQQNGIYYEVVAWGVGKTSWSIDTGFLTGDPSDPSDQVWRDLDAVYQRAYPDAYGNHWPVDAFAVDSGYATNAVYLWCSTRPKARAVKGAPGWNKAAIAAAPSKVEVTFGGKRKRRGGQMWPVGTWSLKAELYANLHKQGLRDGAAMDPPGYCHFAQFHDEDHFKQLTAEYLKDRVQHGRTVKEWVANGPNHLHDCRIYNMAMASHMGIDRMTSDDWARLASDRGAPPPAAQGDLLAMTSVVERAKAKTEAEAPVPGPAPSTAQSTPRATGERQTRPRAPRRGGWLSKRRV